MKLKFASYNIHKAIGVDGVRDPDRIITVLRELNADIIALQEADTRFGIRKSVLSKAALDDTHWKPVQLGGNTPSLGWHGNALLVRRNLKVREADHIEIPTIEPRGAVRADLEVDGTHIRVVGMHLDLSGLRRRHQIRTVLDHINGHADAKPTVLMGDFNQWGVSSGAMTEFGRDWQCFAPGRSFPSRQPVARLDRIVASQHWQLDDSGVHHSALAAAGSDHLPVYADLSLPKKQAGA
ncbi:endonuclease/exonuclease/phosphatase family protein [Altererythrobacter aquiaggeris]|uniref:endonuclease/exonuclease/phosphatase family protein n=1 Tax=Aestuarierythrobacter aquiaggeris TaxID=1898396 RepID=UPI0030172623